MQTAESVVQAAVAAPLPDVVQRVLRGDWPAVLRGPEIVDVIILIECGMSVEWFGMWREDEWENRTWEPYLDHAWTARLETLRVEDVEEPYGGCADPAHAAHYATLSTKAPPIIVEGLKLMDGNHRLVAARTRSETLIDAYVLSREIAGASAEAVP